MWQVVEPGHVIPNASILVSLYERRAYVPNVRAVSKPKVITKPRRMKLSEQYPELPGLELLDDDAQRWEDYLEEIDKSTAAFD
jgi:hypothetical protein